MNFEFFYSLCNSMKLADEETQQIPIKVNSSPQLEQQEFNLEDFAKYKHLVKYHIKAMLDINFNLKMLVKQAQLNQHFMIDKMDITYSNFIINEDLAYLSIIRRIINLVEHTIFVISVKDL